LVDLVRLNYTFIPLNAKILMGALQDSDFQVDAAASALLARLGEADVYVPSAITVVAELLNNIATSRVAEGRRSPATQAVLDAVTSGRQVRPTVRSLQRELDRRMKDGGLRAALQKEINLFVARKRAEGSMR
jgi:hypothetical protein